MLLAACGGGDSASKGSENNDKSGGETVEAKVGVISWLTGSGASYGEAITNGLKLANEELTEKGDVKIDLVMKTPQEPGSSVVCCPEIDEQ